MKIRLHTSRSKTIRLRPIWLPWAWRKITFAQGLKGYVIKRDWQLILNSQSIDFLICNFSGQTHLYVPPLLEKKAKQEIEAYYKENSRKKLLPKVYPVYQHCYLASFFLLPLVLLYGLQHGWWPAPYFLPSPQSWLDLGALDSVKILAAHQWYRLITALTLHASLTHITGNLLFGSIFISLLARLTGAAKAFLLTIIAGTIANFFCVYFHKGFYRSVGFSTALFASLGIIAGIMSWRGQEKKKMLMPIAAAMALLAMLGTEGDNTDYGAHIAGLCSGFGLGLFTAWQWKKIAAIPSFYAGMAALLIPAIAWIFAFFN